MIAANLTFAETHLLWLRHFERRAMFRLGLWSESDFPDASPGVICSYLRRVPGCKETDYEA